MPNLLVLQLKRFSTTASGMEKMNNYMPTPLVLDCFCDECSNVSEGEKLHSYQLYGVIMHLGATMASGHYIAYTRASDHQTEYYDCCRDSHKNHSSEMSKTMNLLKFLKPKLNDAKAAAAAGVAKNGPVSAPPLCKSKDCCGIKLSKSVIENVINSSAREVRSPRAKLDMWLECDDDVVRTLSADEFQSLLGCRKNSPSTPYLLFYSKMKERSSSASSSD